MFLLFTCIYFCVWGILRKVVACAPTAYVVESDWRKFETVFLKLSAIADHFIGGRRALGPPIFRKIPHAQKCMQVKRRKIIPIVKVTKAVLAQTCMGVLSIRAWYNFCSAFSSETAADHRWSVDNSLRNTGLMDLCDISGSHGGEYEVHSVFWDVEPCRLGVARRFKGSYCLHHRPDDGGSTHLWNVGLLKRDYTVLHPRRL
jgi:hypothetical protein